MPKSLMKASLTFFLILSLSLPCLGRYYDAGIGRFLIPDPKANKYPNISPYAYCLNNPLKFNDPDGEEPVKAGLGSPHLASQVLRNVPANSIETLRLCKTTNSNPFVMSAQGRATRYVPAKNGGTIDMLHFTKAASEVYFNSPSGNGLLAKAGKGAMVLGVQIGGLFVEVNQGLNSDSNIRHSSFSSEDIPSNFLGANFGATFDPNKPLFDQVLNYLLDAGAISKEQYIELYKEKYEQMPETEKEAEERYRQENEKEKKDEEQTR